MQRSCTSESDPNQRYKHRCRIAQDTGFTFYQLSQPDKHRRHAIAPRPPTPGHCDVVRPGYIDEFAKQLQCFCSKMEFETGRSVAERQLACQTYHPTENAPENGEQSFPRKSCWDVHASQSIFLGAALDPPIFGTARRAAGSVEGVKLCR